jgi:hypothetical protein
MIMCSQKCRYPDIFLLGGGNPDAGTNMTNVQGVRLFLCFTAIVIIRHLFYGGGAFA